jgi:hypothetical protein
MQAKMLNCCLLLMLLVLCLIDRRKANWLKWCVSCIWRLRKMMQLCFMSMVLGKVAARPLEILQLQFKLAIHWC